jgi:hypothetical protein
MLQKREQAPKCGSNEEGKKKKKTFIWNVCRVGLPVKKNIGDKCLFTIELQAFLQHTLPLFIVTVVL